jgi:hypothetical protein
LSPSPRQSRPTSAWSGAFAARGGVSSASAAGARPWHRPRAQPAQALHRGGVLRLQARELLVAGGRSAHPEAGPRRSPRPAPGRRPLGAGGGQRGRRQS